MIAALTFPLKALGLALFLYALGGGWLILPPSAIMGAF